MAVKEYRFEPEYLDYSGEFFLAFSLHDFQTKIRDIFNSQYDCLFLNAPTGTGKTLSFGLPTFCNINIFQRRKTLIISPTNLLIDQIYKDLVNRFIERNTEIADVRIRKLTGKDLIHSNLIQREEEIRMSFTGNDILVSNPDIISLLISGFYYTRAKKSPRFKLGRLRNPEDIFSKLDVIIFDEYHLYSEEELGKILSFIILSRLTGNRMKIIFSSATADKKMKEIMESMGLLCETLDVSTTSCSAGHKRTVRGTVVLRFSDENMLDHLKGADLLGSSRELYLFDHKIDAERAVNYLLTRGVGQNQIQELTGFMQHSDSKPVYTNKEKFVIATNAAEQGLNLDVDKAHIEPGLYLENLLQRYGRIGRSGASGEITIHVHRDVLKNLPENTGSFKELEQYLRSIFRKREHYASRIKVHYGAFMALCTIRSVRQNLKEQIIELLRSYSDNGTLQVFQSVLDFDRLVEQLSSSRLGKYESQDLKDWWEQFLSSLGYFRGQSNTVSVQLTRSNGNIITTDDLRWIKKWCKFEPPNERVKEYLVTGFYDTAVAVSLEYVVPLGSFWVNEAELNNRERFRSKLVDGINSFIDDAMEGNIGDTGSFRTMFKQVSRIVYPDMLMPKEVLDVSEAQIL
jgi:CRISPR-associated helicase Cas3